jgi:hypothetical protein
MPAMFSSKCDVRRQTSRPCQAEKKYLHEKRKSPKSAKSAVFRREEPNRRFPFRRRAFLLVFGARLATSRGARTERAARTPSGTMPFDLVVRLDRPPRPRALRVRAPCVFARARGLDSRTPRRISRCLLGIPDASPPRERLALAELL